MKKKAFAVLMISALTISMVACGKKDSSKETNKEATTVETNDLNETSEDTTKETVAPTETESETEKVTETESVTETETETETEDTNEKGSDYDGTYIETSVGRGTISIETTGGVSTVEISWASSVFEVNTWTFTGTFDENGTLKYDDCKKDITIYTSETEYTSNNDYSNGEGSITIKDGVLTWDDEEENTAADTTFEEI